MIDSKNIVDSGIGFSVGAAAVAAIGVFISPHSWQIWAVLLISLVLLIIVLPTKYLLLQQLLTVIVLEIALYLTLMPEVTAFAAQQLVPIVCINALLFLAIAARDIGIVALRPWFLGAIGVISLWVLYSGSSVPNFQFDFFQKPAGNAIEITLRDHEAVIFPVGHEYRFADVDGRLLYSFWTEYNQRDKKIKINIPAISQKALFQKTNQVRDGLILTTRKDPLCVVYVQGVSEEEAGFKVYVDDTTLADKLIRAKAVNSIEHWKKKKGSSWEVTIKNKDVYDLKLNGYYNNEIVEVRKISGFLTDGIQFFSVKDFNTGMGHKGHIQINQYNARRKGNYIGKFRITVYTRE